MTDTVPALKRAFLNAQVRNLSAPLSPPQNWRDGVPVPQEGDLRDKVVEEVLSKVNGLLKHHNQSVFPAAALSHVAQQIDALYWGQAEPSIHTGQLPEGSIGRDTDLLDDSTIAELPDSWPDEDEAAPVRKPSHRVSSLETFDSSARYTRLRSRLVELTERRRDAKERLAQAKQLQELLKPLENPRENFQGSLVTRDGELGKELERMKILLARVGGKLGDRIDVRESLEHTRGDSAKNRFDDILKRRGDEMVE